MQQEVNPNLAEKPGAKRGEGFYFAGFKSPNYTPIPDEFFDVLAPNLSEAELRVLLYIMRRTFGFKKQADAISLSQLTGGIRKRNGQVQDEGTGLSKPAALKGVAGLQEKGIITVEKGVAEDGRNEINVYRLRYNEEPKTQTVNPPVSQPVSYSQIEYSAIDYNLYPSSDLRHANSPSSMLDKSKGGSSEHRGGKRVGAKIEIVNEVNPTENSDKLVVNEINPTSKLALLPPSEVNRHGKASLPLPVNQAKSSKANLPTGVQLVDWGSNQKELTTVKQIDPQQGSLQKYSNQETTNNSIPLAGNLAVKLEQDVVVDINNNLEEQQQDEIRRLLTSYGLSERIAGELASQWPPNYIYQKIKLVEELKRRNPAAVRNLPGFIRQAITENYCSAPEVTPKSTTGRFRRVSGPGVSPGFSSKKGLAQPEETEKFENKAIEEARLVSFDEEGQRAALWQRICEALLHRFRRPEMALKLRDGQLVFEPAMQRATIILLKTWVGGGLLSSEEALLRMVFSQEVGPGFNLEIKLA